MEHLAQHDVMGDGRRCTVQPDGTCHPDAAPPGGWRFVRRFVPWIMGGMLMVLVALIVFSRLGGPLLH